MFGAFCFYIGSTMPTLALVWCADRKRSAHTLVEAVDGSSVALGGAPALAGFGLRSALRARGFGAGQTLRSFGVELLGDCRRATRFRERVDDNGDMSCAAGDVEAVAAVKRAGRFCANPVKVDMAAVDRGLGQTARFEKSRSP